MRAFAGQAQVPRSTIPQRQGGGQAQRCLHLGLSLLGEDAALFPRAVPCMRCQLAALVMAGPTACVVLRLCAAANRGRGGTAMQNTRDAAHGRDSSARSEGHGVAGGCTLRGGRCRSGFSSRGRGRESELPVERAQTGLGFMLVDAAVKPRPRSICRTFLLVVFYRARRSTPQPRHPTLPAARCPSMPDT
jgi:hypothetical protein